MKITIVTNGKIDNLSWLKTKLIGNVGEDNFVICADGASRYLMGINFVPDLLLGDLDSIEEEAKLWMEERAVPLKKFPARKNETDTEIALAYSVSKKPQEIEILGAFGSRMDHTLANIQLLEGFFYSNIPIRLTDEQNEIWLLEKYTKIVGRKGETISLLPLTEYVREVTLKGFEYPLENKQLLRGKTLGISNVLRDEEAEISFREGKLLAVIAKD